MSEVQRTFVMVKPDGVQRGLVGEVIQRIEERGLKLAALKTVDVDRELAETHYEEHRDKPFFDDLLDYIRAGPVLALVVEGPEAVQAVRATVGTTDATEASPGTIRGDYGIGQALNLVHASDSPKSAESEIELWFNQEEIMKYERCTESWIAQLDLDG